MPPSKAFEEFIAKAEKRERKYPYGDPDAPVARLIEWLRERLRKLPG